MAGLRSLFMLVILMCWSNAVFGADPKLAARVGVRFIVYKEDGSPLILETVV